MAVAAACRLPSEHNRMPCIVVPGWIFDFDALVAVSIVPLAIAILVSGLDDLVVDLVWLAGWLRRKSRRNEPSDTCAPAAVQRRIAILVPLWREHAVIAHMLEHNIAAIDYQNYDFFVGVYPNDGATQDAVREVGEHHSNIHLAVCPHDGPTSKADCLNWIYQRMLLYEEEHGLRYEIIVTHDAEDVIHPQSLRIQNDLAPSFDMVQIPVLPLPTPTLEIVHGIYCDEFAESQTKDMIVRGMMGSFAPSAGVGTAYSRGALERLALQTSNRVFEPSSLTEDYENGMRLHQLGCPQKFVPLEASVVTREYFPQTLRSAIRQRTRWVTGIALQAWETHGWRGSAADVYWFWRDRKGLIGNPISVFANLLFFYGLGTWAWLPPSRLLDRRMAVAALALFVYRTAIRMTCVGRIYGLVFALGVPLRSICANFVNSTASFLAMYNFARAKIRHEPLVWLKTEHGYPSRTALLAHKRKLGEILSGSGYVSREDVDEALRDKPPDMRLGGYLVLRGLLSEEELCEALSLQQGLPAGPVEANDVAKNAARALPKQVMVNSKVLPFRIASGRLHLATPEVPTDELARQLRRFTGLEVQFQLVTPRNFESLLRSL